MIKNLIILFLLFCLGSLVYDNNKNGDIIITKMNDTKDMVVDGTRYLKKTFIDKETLSERSLDEKRNFDQKLTE